MLQKVILPFFGHWDIDKWSGCKENKQEGRTPWFRARKDRSVLGRDVACHVAIGNDKATSSGYTISGLVGNLSFKITDSQGQLVAEVSLFKNKSECLSLLKIGSIKKPSGQESRHPDGHFRY